MLHTKFCGNRFLLVPEKIFEGLLDLILILNVPVNNFSVMLERATASWVLPVLLESKCVLLMGHEMWPEWGSNPHLSLALESDALNHQASLPPFTIYRRGGHLGHVTQMPRKNFRSTTPREAPHKIMVLSSKRFQRRHEIVDADRRDVRTMEHYKLTCEPSAQVS